MEDHDSPEAVAKRASQEDPIVMYLIVRESLGMSMGKTAAQCAHASQILLLNYIHLKVSIPSQESFASPSPPQQVSIFDDWLESSFRKVVLKADEKEWAKLKLEFKEAERVIVVDAGLTEIAPNSETVIGLWPMKRSNVSKLVKRLQVLK